ncbi:KDGP aldolase, partial [Salmonella enterica subsp. enterica serovar Kentucky]|nr:KDGP aldolase [Salmonella enterica subsp. enterica serovar Kentucky]
TPGLVKISTGPLSSRAPDGIVSIETAIALLKDMGGSSVKYFPKFIIWKFSVTVLFLFTPRRMTLTETALQAGHRVIHYDALESMR